MMYKLVASQDVVLDEKDHKMIHPQYTHHVGNLFYANLLQGCSPLVIHESSLQRVSQRIVDTITLERLGRFVTMPSNNDHDHNKNKPCLLTHSQAVEAVASVLSASLPTATNKNKKRSRTTTTTTTTSPSLTTIRCKVEKQYIPVVSSTNKVHPYALQLLESVVRHNSITVLDQPLHPSTLEPNHLRTMRLQLRHRYLAATAATSSMNVLEYTQKLLEVWGGTLQETIVAAEIVSPNQDAFVDDETLVSLTISEQVDKNDDGGALASVVSDDALDKENVSPSFDDLREADLMQGLDFLDDHYDEVALEEEPTWNESAVPDPVPDESSTTTTTTRRRKVKTRPKKKTKCVKNKQKKPRQQEKTEFMEGSWTHGERLQFLYALREHGCGYWSQIAESIPTRTKSQVKSFGRYMCVKFKLSRNQGPSSKLVDFLT